MFFFLPPSHCHPHLPSCQALTVRVQFVQQQLLSPMRPENMHKVVAHSNMIKWCVVWRHSQHLSHPSLLTLSPSCTNANIRRFPFPEPCCENRRLILTVNSGADRYSLTIPSVAKTSQREICAVHMSPWIRVTKPERYKSLQTHTWGMHNVRRIQRDDAEQMLVFAILRGGGNTSQWKFTHTDEVFSYLQMCKPAKKLKYSSQKAYNVSNLQASQCI